MRPGTLAARRSSVFMPCVGSLYPDAPLELVHGEGVRVRDRDGRSYLDFLCGVAVTSLGHCHPEVVEAARDQLATLQHTTSLFHSELAVEVAERLLAVAPAGMSRVFFCADGSGALDGAMVAARRATGRPGFLAFDLSLHGRTSLAMAATGLPMWRCDPFPPGPVAHVPFPREGRAGDSLRAVEEAIDSAPRDTYAAFVAEPVLGNGGILVPPEGYMARLAELVRARGVLLIADEVQTGLCRTGSWFGMQHHAVAPDIVCVAKALANGLPQGAWMCTEEVARAMTTPLASTFGGNHVAMAAAAKVLEVMERDGLADRSRELGGVLHSRLSAIAGEGRRVCPPRGRGLMLGMQTAGPLLLDAILIGLRRRGVIAGRCGLNRDVLAILPPLIATGADIAEFCDALDDVLRGPLPC